jgi:phage-related protein
LVSQVITWIITNAIAGFKSEIDNVSKVVGFLGGVIGKVFGTIGDVIKGAFNGVVDFVKGIFNTIIGVVNGIIDGINGATKLAGAIGIHIGAIPHLPKLADSGTVLPTPGGTVVRVAEGGRAESVVDTGKLNNLMDAAASNAKRGGDTFNIYEAVSAAATAAQVARRQVAFAV